MTKFCDRRKGITTEFKHEVVSQEEELKSFPKDSNMKRCIICKFPNPIEVTECRACGAENWKLQHYSKIYNR